MSEEHMKEVYFHEYCATCKHRLKKNSEEPCNECLDNPVAYATHKPVKWEEKK